MVPFGRYSETIEERRVQNHQIHYKSDVQTTELMEVNDGNVFAKGLDKSVTNLALFQLFSQFGEIRACLIKTDLEGFSKGFGFVQFYCVELAKEAVAKLHGKLLNGKRMVIGHFVIKRRENNTIIEQCAERRRVECEGNVRDDLKQNKNSGLQVEGNEMEKISEFARHADPLQSKPKFVSLTPQIELVASQPTCLGVQPVLVASQPMPIVASQPEYLEQEHVQHPPCLPMQASFQNLPINMNEQLRVEKNMQDEGGGYNGKGLENKFSNLDDVNSKGQQKFVVNEVMDPTRRARGSILAEEKGSTVQSDRLTVDDCVDVVEDKGGGGENMNVQHEMKEKCEGLVIVGCASIVGERKSHEVSEVMKKVPGEENRENWHKLAISYSDNDSGRWPNRHQVKEVLEKFKRRNAHYRVKGVKTWMLSHLVAIKEEMHTTEEVNSIGEHEAPENNLVVKRIKISPEMHSNSQHTIQQMKAMPQPGQYGSLLIHPMSQPLHRAFEPQHVQSLRTQQFHSTDQQLHVSEWPSEVLLFCVFITQENEKEVKLIKVCLATKFVQTMGLVCDLLSRAIKRSNLNPKMLQIQNPKLIPKLLQPIYVEDIVQEAGKSTIKQYENNTDEQEVQQLKLKKLRVIFKELKALPLQEGDDHNSVKSCIILAAYLMGVVIQKKFHNTCRPIYYTHQLRSKARSQADLQVSLVDEELNSMSDGNGVQWVNIGKMGKIKLCSEILEWGRQIKNSRDQLDNGQLHSYFNWAIILKYKIEDKDTKVVNSRRLSGCSSEVPVRHNFNRRRKGEVRIVLNCELFSKAPRPFVVNLKMLQEDTLHLKFELVPSNSMEMSVVVKLCAMKGSDFELTCRRKMKHQLSSTMTNEEGQNSPSRLMQGGIGDVDDVFSEFISLKFEETRSNINLENLIKELRKKVDKCETVKRKRNVLLVAYSSDTNEEVDAEKRLQVRKSKEQYASQHYKGQLADQLKLYTEIQMRDVDQGDPCLTNVKQGSQQPYQDAGTDAFLFLREMQVAWNDGNMIKMVISMKCAKVELCAEIVEGNKRRIKKNSSEQLDVSQLESSAQASHLEQHSLQTRSKRDIRKEATTTVQRREGQNCQFGLWTEKSVQLVGDVSNLRKKEKLYSKKGVVKVIIMKGSSASQWFDERWYKGGADCKFRRYPKLWRYRRKTIERNFKDGTWVTLRLCTFRKVELLEKGKRWFGTGDEAVIQILEKEIKQPQWMNWKRDKNAKNNYLNLILEDKDDFKKG